MPYAEGEITQLLQEWSEGSEEALDKLMPLVHAELRQKARERFRREQGHHILQPTALVNEVYLRLVKQKRILWQSRTQFFGVAATLMRRILIDFARRKRAGGPPSNLRVSLNEFIPAPETDSVDVLHLHDALDRLAQIEPRPARIVEMRFFGGMKNEEVAEALGISLATVKREWTLAKAWLQRELSQP